MNRSLKPRQWYRLELQMGKIFIAEYQYDSDREEGWFRFTDGSYKQVDTIIPYLASIIEIDPPDLSGGMDIYDFID
jgi:hypothetical protein